MMGRTMSHLLFTNMCIYSEFPLLLELIRQDVYEYVD